MSANAEATLHRVDTGSVSTRAKRPIKRNRESLACASCRIRKLKCDKGHPCTSCVKRNEQAGCIYRKTNDSPGELRSLDRRGGAEEKLARLETLVKQLVESRNKFVSGSHPPSELVRQCRSNSTAPTIGESPGSDLEEDNGPMYIGSTHWSAMLDDIKELKEFIRYQEDDVDTEQQCLESLSIDFASLFGVQQNSTLQNVLTQYLPSKIECDRNVSTYFRAKAIAGPFIHTPQFMRQYQDFWSEPYETPALWVSMLFSILHMSTKVETVSDLEINRTRYSQIRSQRYLIAAAHCLTIGKYYQPKQFSVEALTLYVQCKMTQQLDPSREIGVILGTLIQLAHILGFHRDPDHLRNATPFEKEMRRRTWAVCMQTDLLLSFQLGIPSNIQVGTWNTKLPINLLDSDFDENTKQMPAPRPDTESTRVLFFIAKQKLMIAFERVLRHSLTSLYSDEDEVIMLDCEIRETYLGLPRLMRERTVPEYVAEEPYLIATRHCVEFIYQKSLCVLHRKYVSRGRQESVTACFESASNMVKRFLDMYKEFKPGGVLHSDRWLLSSVMWNDFLMSVLILCLILKTHHKYELDSQSEEKKHDEITKLLKMSWTVCTEESVASRGARKVCRLLCGILAPDDNCFNYSLVDVGVSNDPVTTEAPITASSLVATPATNRQHQHEGATLQIDTGQQGTTPNIGDPLAHMDWGEDFLNAMADGDWSAVQQYLDIPGDVSWDEHLPG